ncbi:unnamed protein product, partial [Mesorhabditis spiculigera]
MDADEVARSPRFEELPMYVLEDEDGDEAKNVLLKPDYFEWWKPLKCQKGPCKGYDLREDREEADTNWWGEEPSIGHEETVGDVYNRERNIELLEMEDVLDVGQAAVGGPELSLASLLSKGDPRVASMNATSAVISTRLVNAGVPTIQQQANRRTLNPMTAYQFSTNAGSSDPGPMSHNGKPELNTITQESNFRDSVIYQHVLQLEQQCYHMIRRMQLCSSVHTAKKYLDEFHKISQEMAVDPGLTGREAEKKPIGIGGKRGFDEMEGGMSTSRGSAPHISQGPRKARVVKSSSARISDVGPMYRLSTSSLSQQMAGPSSVSSAAPSAEPKLEQREIRAFVKKNENGRFVLVKQTVMRRPVNDNELVSINQQQQHPQLDPAPGTSASTE